MDEESASTHTVYWVGWIKGGSIQFLAAGPFVDNDAAQAEIDKHKWSSDRYEIVEQLITVSRKEEFLR